MKTYKNGNSGQVSGFLQNDTEESDDQQIVRFSQSATLPFIWKERQC